MRTFILGFLAGLCLSATAAEPVAASCGNFDMALDIFDTKTGHHAIEVVPGFRTKDSCLVAAKQAQLTFANDHTKVTAICPHL